MGNPVYTVAKITEICHGRLLTSRTDDPQVTDLLIDSRHLIHPDNCLFVALVSGRNDGHKFVAELYEKGVRNFLVSRMSDDRWRMSDACFIVVEDTLTALQELAAFHRRQFHIPVIGITGSNGKTVVKEWLFQLLSHDQRIVRSPKSYNSQIGVALSVWKMEMGSDLAIFEAGISQPGEMEKLEPIIRPTIGIFTNIGTAHDEHFTGHRQKTEEKLKLFSHAQTLVYCSEHHLIAEVLQSDSTYTNLKAFTWSRNHDADLKVTSVEKAVQTTTIRANFQSDEYSFTIPFTDDASIENILHCWCAMIVLGYPASSIQHPASALTPIAMRLELKEAINQCSLINDSYNSDINSLSIAIGFLNQQTRHSKKTVILSDILQTGRDKTELYREIGELMVRQQIDRVIGIGRDILRHADQFHMEHAFFGTTDEFISHFPLSTFRNEAILLKGARIFEFEKISALLQQKAHETVMEVNLDALVHNLNHYRSILKPGTRTMAMVKAFSYGSGSYEIAGILQFHRVDYLAVAYADEGVELRKAGIHLPIMVMSPEEQSLDTLLKFNLEPEIYNLRILNLLEEAISRSQTSDQEEVRIHIKLDTGMHRLGFAPEEMEALLENLEQNPNLRVQSLFSHLAASEDPGEDEFTRGQIAQFEEMSKLITHRLPYPVLRHILNSAGISRFPEAQFDMVRLGIGLYGVGAGAEEQARLRNVSTLRSVITQIKHIKAGDTIGYNRKGRAGEDKTIAIVPIGYADGLNRRLGNGVGRLYINGQPAPIIGNVCMDLTMVDITEAIGNRQQAATPSPAGGGREGAVSEGDPVVIFSDEHPVAEIAAFLGTIPYEVLTGISRRVKRIYYHE
jgi:alanine racemase